MAVAFDAVGTLQTAASGTSASIPITIGTGANRAVIIHFEPNTDTVGIAATIGGETMSIIAGTDGGATNSVVILGKATTLTGSQTVSVTWTNSQGFAVQALSFTGVNQTTPFNNGTNNGTASPLSLTITSNNGDLTTTTANDNTVTPTTNRTQKWTTNTNSKSAGDIGPGTGTTTHSWTATGQSVQGAGANIVQATGSVVTPRGLALLGVGS